MPRHFVRSIKNISYSPTEIKVRNLTSNDPSGPSGADLNEVSNQTFVSNKLAEIVRILNKRLSIRKNSALHILKSLTIIQYCLQVGSQEFVDYYKVHREYISPLIDYDILNKKSKDVINIRKRAKYILKLIDDGEFLRAKRENFHKLRSDMQIPGIKSSEADKSEHIRYSLDHRPNDLIAEEMDSSVSRSLSLDIKRLNYYKKNKLNINEENPHQNGSNKKLHLISEEEPNDDGDLSYKINQLTSNPFRNSVFVGNLSGSNNSSMSSFSDQERKQNNPFII